MLPSASTLQSLLARIDREVLRLGTREHVIAARVVQEAQTEGWSQATLGDALSSVLATDRDTWREIRRVYDLHVVPPNPASSPKWQRALSVVLGVIVLLAVLALSLRVVVITHESDCGTPSDLRSTTLADLGSPDLRPPTSADLGCRKEPIVDPPRTSSEQVPIPVAPLSGTAWVAWLLSILGLGTLGIVLLRLRWYLRRRLAELVTDLETAEVRRKQQQEEQLQASRPERQRLVREALASGQPTRPEYQIELQPPFPSETVEDCATMLGRAYQAQQGRDLDIDGTLASTIKRGGATVPVFLPRREVRELLVLYEDTATRPYLPGFLQLVERWHRLGVRLTVYRFSRHPATVSLVVAGQSRGQELELSELLQKSGGGSLLVFATQLLLRSKQRELDWPRVLRQATVCAWIDPDPRLDDEREDEERTEVELLPASLPRFPFTGDGLLATARYIGSPSEGARPPPWSPPAALTDPTMARWVDLWLALAVQVPDAALNQIEAVRQKLLSTQLPDPRSVGRLLERLRELLGPTFNPGKRTIELKRGHRFLLLLKLLKEEPGLLRRGFALLQETLSTEPQLQPGEEPGLLHHEYRWRRLWYQAGIALGEGQSATELLDPLRGTPMHEVAQEAQQLLRDLATHNSPEPIVVEQIKRRHHLTWATARIPRLLAQSVLFASVLAAMTGGTARLLKQWPRQTVTVQITSQRGSVTSSEERVRCPERPKRKPKSAVAAKVPKQPPKPPAKIVPTPIAVAPGLVPKMMPIRAGRFPMGSEDSGPYSSEKPQRWVSITVPFLLSETEVTQAQYQAVMGKNPSDFSKEADSPQRPVVSVSWFDAVEYCNRLSEHEGLPRCYEISGDKVKWPKKQACTGYRLPTEAEWEYAARAGQDTEYAGSSNLEEVAWYNRNSSNQTHQVRRKKANHWGLHDMSGNVEEWVWDWYAGSYEGAASKDPTGPENGDYRVLRGGAWSSEAVYARVADRNRFAPSIRYRRVGFRLARSNP